jgi:hypothetical protein
MANDRTRRQLEEEELSRTSEEDISGRADEGDEFEDIEESENEDEEDLESER